MKPDSTDKLPTTDTRLRPRILQLRAGRADGSQSGKCGGMATEGGQPHGPVPKRLRLIGCRLALGRSRAGVHSDRPTQRKILPAHHAAGRNHPGVPLLLRHRCPARLATARCARPQQRRPTRSRSRATRIIRRASVRANLFARLPRSTTSATRTVPAAPPISGVPSSLRGSHRRRFAHGLHNAGRLQKKAGAKVRTRHRKPSPRRRSPPRSRRFRSVSLMLRWVQHVACPRECLGKPAPSRHSVEGSTSSTTS